MPHLDFVALREPVTCTLPTDQPGTKRLVRQFRRLELEQYQQAETLRKAGDEVAAAHLYEALIRYCIDGITDEDLNALTSEDVVRIIATGHGKLDIVEAALGNARGGGGASETMENPPPAIPASMPTTHEQPQLGG